MIRITINNDKQQQTFTHSTGPVELGRGPRKETDRIVIHDDSVDEDHLRLRELAEDVVDVENIGQANVIVNDASIVQAGQKARVFLPEKVVAGSTKILIESANGSVTQSQTAKPSSTEARICSVADALPQAEPASTSALSCTPPPPAIANPAIETLLNEIAVQSHFEQRYRLDKRLFDGGMGEVWSAFDLILQRECAIKLGRRDSADDVKMRGQFLKEARIGARLLHPNVLPVFDLGVSKDQKIYFSMRLVHGASLRDSLDAVATGCATNLVRFPLQRVVEAFVRACQGIAYAHQNDVLHLDIKPENILVSGFREVFVMDWGLARIGGQDDSQQLIDLYSEYDIEGTGTIAAPDGQSMLGTLGYMSPEQVLGNFSQFCPATDIFGLGGALYYIMFGTPPCRPRGVSGTVKIAQITTEPQRLGTLRHGILPKELRIPIEVRDALQSLEVICLKALERDPENRYATVEDMVIDLKDWLRKAADVPWSEDHEF